MRNAEKNNNHYQSTLDKWIIDQKAANEFIDVIGKLWYDKDIELIFLRRQLLDRGANSILHKHSYAENIIKKPLTIRDSLKIARAMLELNVAPARIDIGRLNREWTEEKAKHDNDVKSFLSNKLAHIINVPPRSDKTKDVVLYGFGRIGRLLAREIIQNAGRGSQLRLRAIVTRGNSPEEIRKRASLLRKDSVHGAMHGIAVENIDDKSLYINGMLLQCYRLPSPMN